MDDAREVRLGGSILYADLKSLDGTWKRASIDLNVVIGNKDGQLVNGTTNFLSIADGMLTALNSRCWWESVMLSLRRRVFGRCFAEKLMLFCMPFASQ
jgi:hypothetical protein